MFNRRFRISSWIGIQGIPISKILHKACALTVKADEFQNQVLAYPAAKALVLNTASWVSLLQNPLQITNSMCHSCRFWLTLYLFFRHSWCPCRTVFLSRTHFKIVFFLIICSASARKKRRPPSLPRYTQCTKIARRQRLVGVQPKGSEMMIICGSSSSSYL